MNLYLVYDQILISTPKKSFRRASAPETAKLKSWQKSQISAEVLAFVKLAGAPIPPLWACNKLGWHIPTITAIYDIVVSTRFPIHFLVLFYRARR